MAPTRYILAAAHGTFPPGALLEQAAAAERAGFDGVCCDGRPPPPRDRAGAGGLAWPWLGAVGALTAGVGLGTAVAPGPDPAAIARSLATMEAMFPGRTFLGLAPDAEGDGIAREGPERAPGAPGSLAGALDTVLGLLDDRARPPVYVVATRPEHAGLAARRADGLWLGSDGETAPALVDAYLGACSAAGRRPGEVIANAAFAWAPDEASAFLDADRWRAPRVPPPVASGDLRGDGAGGDRAGAAAPIVGPDPGRHVERIRRIAALGATSVVLTNVSASDPLGAIATYGRHVLPVLRAGDATPG